MGNKLSLAKSRFLLGHELNLLQSIGNRCAFLCDCIDAKIKLEKCISDKFIRKNDIIFTKNSDPPKNAKNVKKFDKGKLKNIDTIFILRTYNIDSVELKRIVEELKKIKKNISIYDQSSLNWECWNEKENLNYSFRKVKLIVAKNKLIPSYYYNDIFIDMIIKEIKIHNYKSMLDMCAGSGTIGLSVFKETNLKKIICSDKDHNAIRTLKISCKINNFISKSAKALISDGFKNIKKNTKFDLITLNPPFFDKKITQKFHLNANDPKLRFHRHFFSNAEKYLKKEGKIFLLSRNVKFGGIGINSIKKFIKSTKLNLKKICNINGTGFTSIILNLKK